MAIKPLESPHQKQNGLPETPMPALSGNRQALSRYVVILLAVCGVLNLALFAWGINRGFDIKDESFMLTCYRFPELYAGFTTSFHLIVSRLFGGFDFGLLQARIAGFTVKLLATLVFAWGFWQWLRREEASS
ncbi:MAG TPA: hypothetical protein V6C52_06460 [Coleofasciculaceae cyanobacterium]|jgi:hypothetical protein